MAGDDGRSLVPLHARLANVAHSRTLSVWRLWPSFSCALGRRDKRSSARCPTWFRTRAGEYTKVTSPSTPRLRYSLHDSPSLFRFNLAGSLAGQDVDELGQCWITA